MSELKPCPFCGKALSLFGNDVRNGKLVEVFIHPYEVDDGWDRCPLTSLVFDLERWQLRPIEDELRAELEKRTAGLHYANAVCMEMKHELDRLKEENHALDQINRDIQTAAAHLDEVLAELARLQEKLHDEMSQLEIATDLGNKRWVALNDIYENGEKHNTNWCKRKAQEGLGIK